MAGLMDQIQGHDEQKAQLQNLVLQESLPNGIILNGPSGIGKKLLVRALLQERLCQRDVSACGHCSSCTRVFEERNEFLFELHPKEKKSIGVDGVRELMPFLSLKTLSPLRFVIVDPAEALTPQSANALLKVLEEPPEKTHFFLMTEKFSSLLPTIRSRCQILTFNPLSETEMSAIPGIAPEALGWSRGRPGRALFLSEKENLEQVNQAYAFFYKLLQKELVDWKKTFSTFFQDPGIQNLYFDIWTTCLQKKLRGQKSQDLDFLPEEPQALLAMYQSLQEALSDWGRNVDKVLVIENLYYQFHRGVESPEETLWNSPAYS